MTRTTLTRSQAKPYVAYVVDDSGNGRKLGEDPHAIVRDGNLANLDDDNGKLNPTILTYPSVLVGWQCGFEPLFVAVHSYLDVRLDDDEAADLAVKYLDEIEWFSDLACHEPDFIIR